MGCDIHLHVEVKKGGEWEAVKRMPADNFYKEEYEKEQAEGKQGFWTEHWKRLEADGGKLAWLYDDRNYRLFSILANVRNGFGFAGSDTGDTLTPIAMPRGLPLDVSEPVQVASFDWGDDGHSHSYFTLAELQNYDWEQIATIRGWVNEQGYKEFKEQGRPSSWCSGVGGGLVQHIDHRTMQHLIDGHGFRVEGFSYYTQVQWQRTYRQCCEHFLDECLPLLAELGNSEDVRIVFWFDN